MVTFKKKYFSSDWSRKIADSVFLNSKFRHGHSLAYAKYLNIIILNTIYNAYGYLILIVFQILPSFGYIHKNNEFFSYFKRKMVDSFFYLNFKHSCFSAHVKILNIIIFNTILNAYDYLILIVFLTLPYF